jgi:hypothetical protein
VKESMGTGFNDLHAEERGLLLGMSLQGMEDTSLAALAGERREACGKAWQALRALSRARRAALLAAWIVETNAPFPAGMERLHPSWLAEAIAREPDDLWPALLRGLPGGQAVQPLLPQSHAVGGLAKQRWPRDAVAELQRCVFSELAPLCIGPCGPVGAGLCRLGCDELLTEVAGRGPALFQELRDEGEASLRAVAGRLPATLGRSWLKW